jgi:glycosyltransferase involved in cell wall biosynthesis
MLEAMSAGCLVVGSDTPPVREVIEDSVNGLLADFFSPKEIADRVEEGLTQDVRLLRRRARETVEARYSARELLPRRIEWLKGFAK